MARARSMRPGGGGRFKRLTRKLATRGARSPKALASWIGRKKYGKKRFQSMAVRGRRRR